MQAFYYSRIKLSALITLVIAGLVVFPTFILIYARGWKGPNDHIYMTITTIVFYIIAFFVTRGLAKLFLDRQPVIVINEIGVFDKTISEQFIPWKALADIAFFKYGRPGNRIRLKISPTMKDRIKVRGYWAENLPYFGYIEIVQPCLTVSSHRLFSLISEAFNQSRGPNI